MLLFVSQNSRDLVTVPFVGKCLTFAGGTSIKLKKSMSPIVTDVLFQGGVESVLGNKENKINVKVIFIGNILTGRVYIPPGNKFLDTHFTCNKIEYSLEQGSL